jgi:hypothetical protein
MTTRNRLGAKCRQACTPFAKALLIVLLVLVTSAAASAQINSPVGPITLNASLPSSLTVSANPGLVNFTLLSSGVSAGSSAITITTTYALAANARVTLYAYFTNPASALADAGGQKIPSANVSGSVNGGAFTAFTGAGPYAATSSITIFSRRARGGRPPRTRTYTLNLDINTTGLALPPGNYAGVLMIQAQAI